jgi:transposase
MMQKIPKREYTAELKEQAVKWVKEGKSVGTVAKEMAWSSRGCATE